VHRVKIVAVLAALIGGGGLAAAYLESTGPAAVTVRAGDASGPDLTGADPPGPPETVSLPTVTLPTVPPITVPGLPRRPRLQLPRPVTTVTAPRAVTVACGDPWAYGGLGGSRTVQNGDVSVLIGVVECVSYESDGALQLQVEVHGSAPITAVHFDYGDGATTDSASNWGCDPKRPDPWYLNPAFHTYLPGSYHAVATVTTGSCYGGTVDSTAPVTTTVSIDFERRAGRRP